MESGDNDDEEASRLGLCLQRVHFR
jgi:hypothetical protein